jgi:hypothetical protein
MTPGLNFHVTTEEPGSKMAVTVEALFKTDPFVNKTKACVQLAPALPMI